jgi:hypothetical protein
MPRVGFYYKVTHILDSPSLETILQYSTIIWGVVYDVWKLISYEYIH